MKKKIIPYLLFFTILLLVVNIVLDFTSKKKTQKFDKDLSAAVIENYYLETLDECGIDLKWIKIKPNKDDSKDSLENIINVKIPADLPFPVLLKYLQSKSDLPFVKVTGEEKKKNKEFVLKVFSNNIQKLESNIVKDESVTRAGSRIAFIITGFGDLSKSKQTDLLKSPYPFAVELVPDEKETILVDSLRKFKKEHVVLLNDDIAGSKFLLKESYSKEKLRAAVKNILSAYKYNSLYLIDTASDLFSQSKYGIIEEEIKGNKIRYEFSSSFARLDSGSVENVKNRLDRLLENAGSAGKTARIDAGNYLSIIDKIDKLFRKGNKIIYPSENL